MKKASTNERARILVLEENARIDRDKALKSLKTETEIQANDCRKILNSIKETEESGKFKVYEPLNPKSRIPEKLAELKEAQHKLEKIQSVIEFVEAKEKEDATPLSQRKTELVYDAIRTMTATWW